MRKKSLSHGRPPSAHKSRASLSSKATRTLIRTHHQLQKELTKALENGDEEKVATLQSQIDEKGGLKTYQAASITGQSSERGGDSSKVLIEWLNEDLKIPSDTDESARFHMLEVGALSPTNACSKSSYLHVKRIDLHSQHPAIETQDFMQRPVPAKEDERFDIISLSLVLNYVPDPSGRGEMLRHTTSFFRQRDGSTVFPSLFLVLPAPCVTNSRYMDDARLQSIMKSLGYRVLHRKISSKLVYYLWKYGGSRVEGSGTFPKEEVNPGKTRNNFCIILR